MSNNTQQTTFWNFLKEYSIEIPIIQRDYAQGRKDKTALRKRFLGSLKESLDNNKLLKLDFVYGSTENGKLNPLDGQQRLTTLWLLYWYIALSALKDDELKAAFDVLKKFTYETRVSSREFCEHLCDPKNFINYQPDDNRKTIVDFITNQTWFFSAWNQDPTIQAMLTMLSGIISEDGIESVFGKELANNYWSTLTSDECPIIFYYLDLLGLKLSDDLYIKMNARGEQLTSFENFKADLIKYIRDKSISSKLSEDEKGEWKKLLDPTEGLPIKMDTTWMDLFWKNKSDDNRVDKIYFTFINRFFWNELFIAKKDDDTYILDIGKGDETSTKEKENKSYAYLNEDSCEKYEQFEPYKYSDGEIPIDALDKLQTILDNLSSYLQQDTNFIPSCQWMSFDFIPRYDKEMNATTPITQQTRIVFYALCQYFSNKAPSFDSKTLTQWLRVVYNLVSGEDKNGRYEIRTTSSMRSAIAFISKLDSHNVYKSLKDTVCGNDRSAFNLRCIEEKEKAKQILDGGKRNDNKTWEEVIIEAENYAFFKGSIRFLYINEDGKEDWDSFETKACNVKNLIPQEETNRHTIKNLTEYVPKEDLLDIYHQHWISNKDEDLRVILLDDKCIPYLHNFLLQNNIKPDYTNLHRDIINLCEKVLGKRAYLQTDWKDESEYIWTNYSRQTKYHEGASYVVGNADFARVSGIIMNSTEFEKNEEQYTTYKDIGYIKGLALHFKYENRFFNLYGNNTICLMTERWEDRVQNPNDSKGYCTSTQAIKSEQDLKENIDSLLKYV